MSGILTHPPAKKSRSAPDRPLFNFFFKTFLLLMCMALFTGCENDTVIVHDLYEAEANEMIVYLTSEGITTEKIINPTAGGPGGGKVGPWMISVKEEDASWAMSILTRNGLPRKSVQTLLDLFGNDGLVPSEISQKIRQQQGVNNEIANTIRSFDGIIDVSVHVSLPPEDNSIGVNTGPKPRASASIYIKHNGVLDDPNSHLVTKIKRLVAGAVSQLAFEDITIVPDKAVFASARIPGHSPNDKKLVQTMGITMTEETLGTFRSLITGCFVAIALLLAFNAWLVWKSLLVIRTGGGMKMLLDKKQFPPNSSALMTPKVEEVEDAVSVINDREDDEEDEEDERMKAIAKKGK